MSFRKKDGEPSEQMNKELYENEEGPIIVEMDEDFEADLLNDPEQEEMDKEKKELIEMRKREKQERRAMRNAEKEELQRLEDERNANKAPPPILPQRLEYKFPGDSTSYEVNDSAIKMLVVEDATMSAPEYTLEDFEALDIPRDEMPGYFITVEQFETLVTAYENQETASLERISLAESIPSAA